MKLSKVLLYLLLFLSFSACKKTSSSTKSPKKLPDTASTSALDERFYEAKQVVYSLPSPQEISITLLESKDVNFNPSLMDNLSKVDNYTSDLSLALNLGIMIADVTYATIFGENDYVMNYVVAAQNIADRLGLLNYFSSEDLQKMKKNLTNRDEIMDIITKAYMRADEKLQEDDRDDIGALVLIGGWIEGMYLAVNTINGDVTKHPKLVSSIAEQQLSLALLVDFLHYYSNDKLLSEISSDIYQLDKIFQSIHTDIDSDGNIIIKQKDFDKLAKKIDKIRNSYVNLT